MFKISQKKPYVMILPLYLMTCSTYSLSMEEKCDLCPSASAVAQRLNEIGKSYQSDEHKETNDFSLSTCHLERNYWMVMNNKDHFMKDFRIHQSGLFSFLGLSACGELSFPLNPENIAFQKVKEDTVLERKHVDGRIVYGNEKNIPTCHYLYHDPRTNRKASISISHDPQRELMGKGNWTKINRDLLPMTIRDYIKSEDQSHS